MPKQIQSQWDFGEAVPATPAPTAAPAPSPPARRVLTVAELTLQVKHLLEQGVGLVWVTGEISNLRLQSSGHMYFALKDASSQLSCVLFRGEAQVDRSLLQDGRKVNLRGELTVYEPRGQYQLRVIAAELEGAGALQAAFEKLKQKLNAEGLFAPERKRPLPRYPQRIGLVTSPTGAALRDVLHVVQRRNPALEIILAPCRVQGEGAAAEIARAIRLLNELHAMPAAGSEAAAPGVKATRRKSGGRRLDLIMVTRGGGSLEDLWAFNEEIVARAIFESALPVVSAIGHEIDFTISDFVADVRAATPSAGAEIITEGVFASCQFLSAAAGRMRQLARQQWEDRRDELARAGQRLARVHPRRRLDAGLQHLDDLQSGLARCARQGARRQRLVWQNLADRLSRVRPRVLLKQRREVFELAKQRLGELTRHGLQRLRNRLATVEVRLRLLGPEQVLARGYSITSLAESGELVRDAAQVKPGERLRTRLKKGEVRSVAES
jgi:exodeoxyribonuclease VII large subunit